MSISYPKSSLHPKWEPKEEEVGMEKTCSTCKYDKIRDICITCDYEKKDCTNCKYADLAPDKEPCVFCCIYHEETGKYAKWTPEKSDLPVKDEHKNLKTLLLDKQANLKKELTEAENTLQDLNTRVSYIRDLIKGIDSLLLEVEKDIIFDRQGEPDTL